MGHIPLWRYVLGHFDTGLCLKGYHVKFIDVRRDILSKMFENLNNDTSAWTQLQLTCPKARFQIDELVRDRKLPARCPGKRGGQTSIGCPGRGNFQFPPQPRSQGLRYDCSNVAAKTLAAAGHVGHQNLIA